MHTCTCTWHAAHDSSCRAPPPPVNVPLAPVGTVLTPSAPASWVEGHLVAKCQLAPRLGQPCNHLRAAINLPASSSLALLLFLPLSIILGQGVVLEELPALSIGVPAPIARVASVCLL